MSYFLRNLALAITLGLGVWGAVTAFFIIYVLINVLLIW